MDAVDDYIPTPARNDDLPFLMPVEDVFTISGRGTVATGRVERGALKLSEEVEIVGLSDEKQQDRRHRHRDVPQAAGRAPRPATTSAPCCAAWTKQRASSAARCWPSPAPSTPTPSSSWPGLRPDQGRGRPSHPLLQQLSSPVLLPHHRRHRRHHPARGHRDVHARRQRGHEAWSSSPPSPLRRACVSPSARAAVPWVPALSPTASRANEPSLTGSQTAQDKGTAAAKRQSGPFCLPAVRRRGRRSLRRLREDCSVATNPSVPGAEDVSRRRGCPSQTGTGPPGRRSGPAGIVGHRVAVPAPPASRQQGGQVEALGVQLQLVVGRGRARSSGWGRQELVSVSTRLRLHLPAQGPSR